MAAVMVVEDFDVLKDGRLGFSASLIVMPVGQFVLERMPEAFHRCVVIAAGATTHAGDQAVGGEGIAVVFAGVLAATVAVMDKAWRWLPVGDCHIEGLQD